LAVRAVAAHCKLPFALRPGLSEDHTIRLKEITKGNDIGKVVIPYSSSADTMKEGMGRNSGRSSSAPDPPIAPSSSASAPCSSSRSQCSRSFYSNIWLPALSSLRGSTSIPTSVEVRKSSAACSHLLSASRLRNFPQLFHLPVSLCTSAHSNFCCIFHSGHTLKRWSLVCEGHLHHQHWASGQTLAQWRYCPLLAWPVFSWLNLEASLLVLSANAPSGFWLLI